MAQTVPFSLTGAVNAKRHTQLAWQDRAKVYDSLTQWIELWHQ